MYFLDFSNYENRFANIYNIGWLDISQPYPSGQIDMSVLNKLIILKTRLHTNQMRGYHLCSFCEKGNSAPYIVNQQEMFLGSAEIWIPNKSFNKIFAAPNLIIHYIYKHSYLPPQEFINAIVDFDINCDWSSKKAYESCIYSK